VLALFGNVGEKRRSAEQIAKIRLREERAIAIILNDFYGEDAISIKVIRSVAGSGPAGDFVQGHLKLDVDIDWRLDFAATLSGREWAGTAFPPSGSTRSSTGSVRPCPSGRTSRRKAFEG
jgi:hypothetical protein